MGYSDSDLFEIFWKANGVCHICCGREGRIVFKHYGNYAALAAWEVSHHKAKRCGGTDAFSNLFPAHIACNRRVGANHCTRAPKHSHNARNAMCCSTCAGESAALVRAAPCRGGSASGSEERCHARLACDSRLRCENGVNPGRKYCGVHRGWRRGSF